MTTDPTDFSATIDRFSGFADIYDKYRPAPPATLANLLTQIAGAVAMPSLVVDLGCGTGLSTRYWDGKAKAVIGVEPSADMLLQAQIQTLSPSISYRKGLSSETGLPDHCADIVTCSQSLHWMDPQSTFREAARILRPGGVFAANDYDWPPTTGIWQAEAAYTECMGRVNAYSKQCDDLPKVHQWDKSRHLSRMRESGCFRFVKEILVHHVDEGNADRLVGLLLSQGSVMTLLKRGVSEKELGIDLFRQTVEHNLGLIPRTWYWHSRIRCGVV